MLLSIGKRINLWVKIKKKPQGFPITFKHSDKSGSMSVHDQQQMWAGNKSRACIWIYTFKCISMGYVTYITLGEDK